MSENNSTVWAIPNWSRKQAPGLAQFAAENKDSWSDVDAETQMAFQAKWGEVAPGVPFPFTHDGAYIAPREVESSDDTPTPGKNQVSTGAMKVRLWTCDRKCYGDSGKLYKPGDQITTLDPPSDYFKDEDGNRRKGAKPKMEGAGKQGRKINHPLIKVPKKAASPADIDAINEMRKNNAEPDIIAKTLNLDPALVIAIVNNDK